MSIRADIFGPVESHEFFESAENLDARTHRGIEKALWQSGKDVNAEHSRQVLAKDKTGRLYIRVNRAGARRRHIASAPGETPANRTGNYRRSQDFFVRQGLTPELVIGNTAEYAGFLETGTKRMKPRPGIRNAIQASERDIIRNLADGIEEEI